MCLTAAKYTLMVVCEMLMVAKYVAKSIKVSSVDGTGVTFNCLQKLVNLIWPAEYVLSVDAARPFA